MKLEISGDLRKRFPDLWAPIEMVFGVEVKRKDPAIQKFKKELLTETRRKYDLESLKDQPIFKAYRSFFWGIGIDPTKTRPAAEALVRRVLQGRSIPRINTLVDAYNLASIESGVALAAFDADRLKGDLIMRLAESGEKFLGIGMESELRLDGGEVVVSDEEKLIAIYPYRDSDGTKITSATNDVLLMICGVPGIEEEVLEDARRTVLDYVTRFCDGRVGELE